MISPARIRQSLAICALAVLIPGNLVARTRSSRKSAAAAAAIDINSAPEAVLDTLPGIGHATARKIVAGRPYASVSDLSRVGVESAVIRQITPRVKVGPLLASPIRIASVQQTGSKIPSAPAPGGGPGFVWVNTQSDIYYRQGDAWYGKTKHGKYMPEGEAIKAGYHLRSRIGKSSDCEYQ